MKQKFKDHKATFADYGNIKILDFKKPNSTEYRIRFIFEEDYCRLHISGDLGQLVATNYRNMCWIGFNDFVEDVGAYEKTIKCYFKPTWREADSKEKLLKNIAECLNNITANNVLRIVEIARPGNIMFGVKLEHFENRKVLRYSKLTNKILIDGWYIKDNDLEAALKRYLAYEEN